MRITRTKFELFMNIENAGGAIFSPLKDEFVFVYDSPGTFQVFRHDLKRDKWPQRISFREDRCTNPRFLPTGEIIYSTDNGGDENFQLRIIGKDLLEREITTDEKAKHMLGYTGKKRIYLSANIENKGRFDVYYFDLPVSEGSKAEKLFDGFPGTVVLPVTANNEETKLAVLVYRSNMDSDIYVYDLSNEKLENVVSGLKQGITARFFPDAFLSDTELLIRTDYESEFLRLAILNIESQEITWLTEDQWDVEEVEFHRDSAKIVFSKNEDGYSKLYLVEKIEGNKISKIKRIKLPFDGVLATGDLRSYTKPLSFNSSGDKLLVSFTSGTKTLNAWVYDFEDGSFSQATFAGTAGIPEDVFVEPELHKFKSFDGLEVPYFFYPAKNASKDNPSPCVFIIHGGPEAQIRPSFSKVIQYFVSEGFSVVTPNIRGSSGYGKTYMSLDDKEKRLDSIRDIKELAEYLKKHEKRINPEKLAIYGGSYGGFAVLSSITEYPGTFQAAVDIVGISNFVTFLKNTAAWRRKLREAEYGSLEEDYDMLVRISPIHKVDRIVTPLLIIQGDNDERVPLSEALQIYEALKSRNVPVELLRFADEGHGIAKRKNQVVAYKKIVDFLKKHIG